MAKDEDKDEHQNNTRKKFQNENKSNRFVGAHYKAENSEQQKVNIKLNTSQEVYESIGKKIFDILEDRIITSNIKIENTTDVILHMMNTALKKFLCCDKNSMNFSEYVIHCNTYHSTKSNFQKEVNEDTKIENKKISIDFDEVSSDGKPFKCSRKNCKKSFLSENGLKYHNENGHKFVNEDSRKFHCKNKGCGKKYKNYNGLKYHLAHYHKDEIEE